MQRRSELRRTGPPPRNTRLATVTPMPQRSAKRAREQRQRSRSQRAEHGFGDLRPACEVRWDARCHGWADAPHHVKKQSQGGSDALANTLPCCSVCNGLIEDHPAEARRRGLVVWSWEPEPGGAA